MLTVSYYYSLKVHVSSQVNSFKVEKYGDTPKCGSHETMKCMNDRDLQTE